MYSDSSTDSRTAIIREGQPHTGPVVYWMSRDQRVADNWALIEAQALATESDSPLVVVFCLVDRFLGAGEMHFRFMLEGLREVASSLKKLNLPFYLLSGNPPEQISSFCNSLGASCLVTDYDPLRIKKKWRQETTGRIDCRYIEVDTHNIVPCRVASSKQEFSAATFRRKISPLLDFWLTEFPALKKQDNVSITHESQDINWESLIGSYCGEPISLASGEAAAHERLQSFVDNGLARYDSGRNDPSLDCQSGLSPYLHFGQISAQRVALEVRKSSAPVVAKAAFLEELIIRRELSDNFCHYNENYDRIEGIHPWARATLDTHREDPREYIYTPDQFERGETHDPLWNAAQCEMVTTAKMHGYMRMYWAKKILEWTASPEEAIEVAVTLNDRYSLDGRDPNGYVGVLWSVGGLHDRAWAERPVFGKVRYMNYNGCKRKFDVEKYIRKYL